jgi:hypothetical protein
MLDWQWARRLSGGVRSWKKLVMLRSIYSSVPSVVLAMLQSSRWSTKSAKKCPRLCSDIFPFDTDLFHLHLAVAIVILHLVLLWLLMRM